MEKGFDATSMSMIADAVGISKPNLYYYCTSKENLLYEIQVDFSHNKFLPILEIAEKVADPADRIAHFLREFTLLNTSSPANWTLVHDINNSMRNIGMKYCGFGEGRMSLSAIRSENFNSRQTQEVQRVFSGLHVDRHGVLGALLV